MSRDGKRGKRAQKRLQVDRKLGTARRYGRWMIAAAAVAVVVGGTAAFLLRGEPAGEEPAPSLSPISEATPPPATPSGAAAGEPPATYVGVQACATCHAQQYESWRSSHHARAMQEANEHTVLGDFSGAKLTYAGVTSTFFRRDGKFWVNTDGADGRLSDFEIRYTFGVSPLQQYLVEFPGGRLQALGIAWDSRPKQAGGHRWFHLYPGQKIRYGDPLHWTGPNQNWNYMCADCHSTNLEKHYDLAADRFATTWSDLDVACEACHGPGSRHVAAASAPGASEAERARGVVVPLADGGSGGWTFGEPPTPTKHWTGAPRSDAEIDACAPCHSRRRQISEARTPGERFLDRYVPALLDEGLYFPDGQILEEDYEYGSFLQSKMYRMGVRCSDCHEPHGLALRAKGNALCTRCHSAERFDRESHHHHPVGSTGAECANCHMPERLYMVIDARRDHSLRIPRPDFSLAYGTPNACTRCHTDRTDQWAADTVARWTGPERRRGPHFVSALYAGRRGSVEAGQDLVALAKDSTEPGIARATAVSLMPPYLTVSRLPALEARLADRDALVRLAAARALGSVPPQRRRPLAALLGAPIRAVRIAAARSLVGVPPDALSPAQRAQMKRDLSEWIAAEEVTAERPEAHLNLSVLYLDQGRPQKAEAELQTALRIDPRFVPALLNLADLRRAQHRDAEGEKLLRRAMEAEPQAAEPVHAMGLLRIRQGRRDEGIALLKRSTELQPDVARYAYVYGVALQSSGKLEEAVSIFRQAHRRHPADREILVALIGAEREQGDRASAKRHAEELVRLAPDDPGVSALLEQLR